MAAANELQGGRNMHLAVSDEAAACPEDDSNDNAKQIMKAKQEKIAQMFLARPAVAEAKIAVSDETNACPEDDSNDNAVQIMKAKQEKIAQMFLARPAVSEAKIAVSGNMVQEVKMTKNKKNKEKKNKDKKKKTKDKKIKKIERCKDNAGIEAEKKYVPNEALAADDEITVIEEEDDPNKSWKLLSCFDFILSWLSKKYQKHQAKLQEKKERKRWKGLTVVEIHAPPKEENEGDLDACDVDIYFS
ncbi:multiple RNA-binding domain-containing protein 1-like [Mercenaria mercenaria]|uniref:multiple RNA-binding domain-containing protein 1-like n=1 Tax=Mercenaria mercenaria TaxID=6596 RepID=UPI00234F44B9|nr:multiple RNA-binding domain-containing protein 1-like [Mercenaria mercenaria]